MEGRGKLQDRFAALRCCVIIPTYNNQKTIGVVIADVLQYTHHVIVVNDGATDETPSVIKRFKNQITIITQPVNRGKGMALRTAFSRAVETGYRYAITIDSDGQHFPSDFESFLNEIEKHPDSLIIGARNMNSENVPEKSSFGNKFSNFWFRVETGISLPDTQSGYRLYPIEKLNKIRFFTSRFEFEIEVIVKAAWHSIPVISIPIQVYYAKSEERVTHFKPSRDSTRISFLNAYLTTLALIWYRPLLFLKNLSYKNIKQFIKDAFFDPEEPVLKKSVSVSVGFFFGILPIWGYQLVSAIAAAYLLKLNKGIVIVTANISVPPMIPFILLASVKTGEWIAGKSVTLDFNGISLESVKSNLYVYITGACWLALIFSVSMGIITYAILSLIRKLR